MMEQNEIENSNVSILTENKKRYKLHIDEEIAERIQAFCETFFIELNNFIVKTVGYHLYNISDDM